MLNLKKIRFLVMSGVLIGLAYFLAFKLVSTGQDLSLAPLVKFISFLSLVTVLSSLFIQYIEGGDKSLTAMIYVGLVPLALVAGCFLFFLYYPNTSVIIKFMAGLFYVVLLYTLLLLNNVLLVVGTRDVRIPVYRVAINWVQIVLLCISMTLFTGLLKAQVHPLLQMVLIMLVAYFSYTYLLWVYSYDHEIRRVKIHEGWVLSAIFALLSGWGTFTTLFFPAESFLRGIFVASVYLLGLGYMQLYLKNALSKKSLWDYLAICLIFLGILVVFRP